MTNPSGCEISPFIAMEVLKAANQREQAGDPVFHMEVGQPALPASFSGSFIWKSASPAHRRRRR